MHKADLNLKTKNNETALLLAVKNGMVTSKNVPKSLPLCNSFLM